jgi:hypothetical protein
MHGKLSQIHHDGTGVFQGFNRGPFLATRYHSLVIERQGMPSCLRINAETADGIVMGVVHRERPIHGVQHRIRGRPRLARELPALEPAPPPRRMTIDTGDFKALIAKVAAGARLSEDEAAGAFDAMMSGNATPAQMGGFLLALRVRGETVPEITGAARAMRAISMGAALLPELLITNRQSRGVNATPSSSVSAYPSSCSAAP